MIVHIVLKQFQSKSTRLSSSFAFAGCGWLVPFHLGVIKKMQEKGVLTNDSIAAGTSGGSLAALVAVNDIAPEKALEYIIHNSTDKSFRGNIDIKLKLFLKRVIPHDALQRSNGRLYVCVSRIWPKPRNQPVIISQYESIDNILSVIAASCFIPLYSHSRRIATKISVPSGSNNSNSSNSSATGSGADAVAKFYVDGGLHAWMPPIGKCTNHTHVLRCYMSIVVYTLLTLYS